MTPLRILHTVELYDPSVGGAQEVVRQVSRRLAERGHSVTVATSHLPDRVGRVIDGVRIEEFAVSGNAVRGMSGEVDRYRDYVLRGDFDVVMGYAAQQWTTDALLDVVDDIPYARVLAPCGFSGLRDPAYAEYFAGLAARLESYDRLIFHSDTYQDIEFARAAGLRRLTVIPNGADERELPASARAGAAFRARHGLGADVPLLLTVGGLPEGKARALVMEALARLRADRAALVIMGNRPLGFGCAPSCRVQATALNVLRRGRRRVLLLDAPREETLAAYAAADLFVFGSNIECSPLVLFEAMAAGLPFVTLPVGNAAEIAAWSAAGRVLPGARREDGRVVGRARDMAEAVDALLADPAERRGLGAAGQQAWRGSFTWDVLAGHYEQVYRQAVDERARRPTPSVRSAAGQC